MNPRRSFFRKIAYLVAIALLLVPLFWLSQPATTGAKGTKGSPGGQLAQLRDAYGLSEAKLGEIDPTSETIKLATFGMRGVAVNILWEKANRYKMKKDWTNLSATLQQIAKLEPHFIAVWRHQAWNLSYNVSAEFDDYRERYRWVIKGIDFLKIGIRYNEHEPRLLWDLGWFVAQKIGRADEAKQFRRLFKDDDDFHGSRPPGLRDNWLVGKEWFAKAEELVDGGASLRGMSPVIFFSDRPMCQMNYAEALEKDGIFGGKARQEWNLASREWTRGPCEQVPFGDRDIPTAYGDTIRLNDRESFEQTAARLKTELDALAPGLREKIGEEKRASLTDAERQALDAPISERTEQQHVLASEAGEKLEVTHTLVAQRVTGPQRSKALQLAEDLTKAERMATIIRRYRQIVNFAYWRRRARIEQTAEARAAREFIYHADRFSFDGRLPEARNAYDAGLAKWRELLDKPEFAGLVADETTGQELVEIIDRYRKLLDKRDEPFPEDFILQDVLDLHERARQ